MQSYSQDEFLALKQRFDLLVKRVNDHARLSPGDEGRGYPHPDQVVRSLTFGRKLRLDDFLKNPTDGQVLSADSTKAGKLKWLTPTVYAPLGAQYLVVANDATLTAERALAAGVNVNFVDGGANSAFTLAAINRALTPAQITANQNDYNPAGFSTADYLRLDTSASWNITGMLAGSDGAIKITHNKGAFNVVFKREDAGSAAANRFNVISDVILGAGDACIWQYDLTSARWRAVSRTGLATGTAVPLVESGAGAAGTGVNASHEDHVHPAASGGGWSPTPIAKSTAYTAVANDFILADATGASFNVTLPAAASNTNKVISMKKVDASIHTVSFIRAGADTIDGATSVNLLTQYEQVNVVSDGTNWWTF